jgi:non-specific serine/threonine protein kinase
MAALLGDDLPAARTWLESALDGVTRLEDGFGAVESRIALAMATLLGGDPDRATALCAECREFCESRGEQWWLSRTFIAAGHVALRTGDLKGAAAYTRRATELARELGSVRILALSVERWAWIAGAEGDHERAARLLGAANQMWQQLVRKTPGAVFWRHGSATCEAAARAALGDVVYWAEFRRGAALTLDEAIRYVQGAAYPRVAMPEPEPGPVLTPREREVAGLVAEGLSNRQIAVRLGTSQRTAESHVENILRKLAFTARTQIAAWVVQRPASNPTTGLPRRPSRSG